MKKTFVLFALLLLLGISATGQATAKTHDSKATDEAKASLVPLLHHPMDGRISVKNVGSAPAGPTKLTLDCVRLGAPVQMNSCPDLPPSVAATYFDPTFPRNATIQVPTLTPGETFTLTLTFWSMVTWPTGKYRFTAIADAGHVVSTSTTEGNIATTTLVVP
jgi:hypothetical protein